MMGGLKPGKDWQKTGKKPASLKKPAKDWQKAKFPPKVYKLTASEI